MLTWTRAQTVAVLLLWLLCLSLTSYKAATGELVRDVESTCVSHMLTPGSTQFHSPCLAAVGGEPPSSIGPSRQYSYTPRPPRKASTSRSPSAGRAFWSRSTSRGRRL